MAISFTSRLADINNTVIIIKHKHFLQEDRRVSAVAASQLVAEETHNLVGKPQPDTQTRNQSLTDRCLIPSPGHKCYKWKRLHPGTKYSQRRKYSLAVGTKYSQSRKVILSGVNLHVGGKIQTQTGLRWVPKLLPLHHALYPVWTSFASSLQGEDLVSEGYQGAPWVLR